jgi:hypothetical protein
MLNDQPCFNEPIDNGSNIFAPRDSPGDQDISAICPELVYRKLQHYTTDPGYVCNSSG